MTPPVPVTIDRGPVPETTRADWQTDQEVRWCPGCGDYSILAAMQFALPDMGVRREDVVVVGGIGCAARFPYYVNSYGLHGIHGRAPAIATGIALANPDLSVFVIGGDGDLLSIGGNHLLHSLRRNVNLTILLFNNRIYGLTKGQYSPTSEVGKITKSTPRGSEDAPLHPLSVALGADATLRGPHPRHGPQAHDGDLHPGPRPPGRGLRRGPAELQRVQRRRLRRDHLAGPTARTCSSRWSRASPSASAPTAPRAWSSTRPRAPWWSTWPTSAWTPCWCTTRPAPIPASPSPSAGWPRDPTEPTPMGVFRAVERPVYGRGHPVEATPPGREALAGLLRSGSTWTVD